MYQRLGKIKVNDVNEIALISSPEQNAWNLISCTLVENFQEIII